MSSAELLRFHFERKKKAKPSFSLRSFAKLLEISPSFVSGMFSGKKVIPLLRLNKLFKILDMDPLAQEELKAVLAAESLQSLGHTPTLRSPMKKTASQNYQLASKANISILANWYYVAILDLTTCANFKSDYAWIAAKLGLSLYQVEFAIRELVRSGIMKETPNGFKKVQKKMRLAFIESKADIRKFHVQMIDKAKDELLSKTSAEDFKRREIAGITIATNPKNIERAQIKLIESLHEVAEILSEGETTELYQINAQLFTLLKN